MALTGPQLTQLAKHPHSCRVWVSVFQPSVVFEADVETGFYDHNVVQIPYENGVGTPSDVLDGMTLYVYSNTGDLKGIMRAKSADSSYIYVAENDEVTFDDGQSLVITDSMPPWTKFPTCDISGDDPIFYKDYDVAYSDQNVYPPPVPVLGPTLRCLVLDQATSHTWDASGSYSSRSGGSISTYSWVFEGGTPGSSGSPSVAVTYDTPGLYRTKLVITDDQSKTATAYRWIRVIDTIQDADLIKCDVSLTGSFSEGGWKAKIEGFANLSLSDVPDQSLIAVSVLALDGNAEEFEFGGFIHCHQIYFCGYLDKDTVKITPDTGWTSFEAITLDRVMTQMFNFDVFVYDVTGTPANWLEINDLDTRKAGYHLLRWHSNVFELADVQLPDASARTAGIDMPQSNLFTQLKNMCQTVRLLKVGCSRYGSIVIEPDVQYLTWSARQSRGKNHDMFKAYYKGDGVIWPRMHRRPYSMIELAGVVWDGTEPEPLFSRSPGIVPVHEGTVKEISGLAVEDQDDLNTLCGMVYAEMVNLHEGIRIPKSGNWMPALDIFPQAMVKLPYDFEVRGVNIGDNWVVVRTVTFTVQDYGAPVMNWTVDRLNDEFYGRAFYYPTPEETFIPPSVPPPTSPPPAPPPPATTTRKVIIATFQHGIWLTSDFDSSSPTWGSLNNGLSGNDLNPQWFARDPVNYKTQAYLATKDSLLRNDAIDSNGTWVTKCSQAQLTSIASGIQGSSADWACVRKMKPQICMPGAVFMILSWHMSDGSADCNMAVIYTTDRMQTFAPTPKIVTKCGSPLFMDYVRVCGPQDDSGYGWGQLVASPHTPWKLHLAFSMRAPSSLHTAAYYMFPDVRDWFPSWLGRWYYHGAVTDGWTPSCHVPYKDNYNENLIYVPGGGTETYRYPNQVATALADCNALGSRTNIDPAFGNIPSVPSLFGSYTWDKNRIWFAGKAKVIGVSNDGGSTWTQKTDCITWPGCASGFPYNNQLFIVGLAQYHATDDVKIAASYDGGETWQDKTGDLVTKVRTEFADPNAQPALVTIAPEW